MFKKGCVFFLGFVFVLAVSGAAIAADSGLNGIRLRICKSLCWILKRKPASR
jgi:hypothetical protein